MIPPIPILEDYNVSLENGFLPFEPPLEFLPDLYFAKWEAILKNLQPLLLSKRLRAVVDQLPVLSTSRLQGVEEWRRAYVVLVFIAHGYIWGGDKPSEVGQPSELMSRFRLTEQTSDTATSRHDPTL
jgi:indoleamine 2,3-dioxygenase